MRPNPQFETEDELDWNGTLLDRNPRRRPQSSYQPEPKSRLFTIGIVVGVAAIAITLAVMLSGGNSAGETPMIKADTTPYKSKPDQPGGAQIPFQDKLVFNRLDPNGQPVQAEKLLPEAEQPMNTPAAAPAPLAPAAVTAPPPATVAAPIAVKPVEMPAPVAAPVQTVTPQLVEETPAAPVATTAPVAKTVVTPKPTPAPVVTQAAPTPAPVIAAPVTKPAAPVAAGQVRLQLASIPSAGNAQKALSDLSAKYRSALGGATLSIVKADLGAKGIYYRIQSSGVDSASATRICNSIKAQGGACITAK